MPTRKLVKHGPSTFMVSLPKEWVDNNQLGKGESIDYLQKTDSITFFAPKSAKKEYEIDVSGLTKSYVMLVIRALYRQGASQITVRFEEPEIIDTRTGKKQRVSAIIQEELENLIGVEVESHSLKKMVLKQLSEPQIEDLKPNLRRVFFILSGAYGELVDAIRDDRLSDLKIMDEKQLAIVKFVNYAVRVLNLTYHEKDARFLLHGILQLEQITNYLCLFTQTALEKKTNFPSGSQSPLELLGEIHSIVDGLFFEWDAEKANRLDDIREEVISYLAGIDEPGLSGLMQLLIPVVQTYWDIALARLSMIESMQN